MRGYEENEIIVLNLDILVIAVILVVHWRMLHRRVEYNYVTLVHIVYFQIHFSKNNGTWWVEYVLFLFVCFVLFCFVCFFCSHLFIEIFHGFVWRNEKENSLSPLNPCRERYFWITSDIILHSIRGINHQLFISAVGNFILSFIARNQLTKLMWKIEQC